MAKKKDDENGAKVKGAKKLISIRPIQRMMVTMRILGLTPLIQHAWAEKAKQMMRDKHAGKKTKSREARDPEKEGYDAAYRTAKGDYGIVLTALKSSIIGAAHKDLGIEKTLVRKALFIHCDDPGHVLKMECSEPVIQEDNVRVGQGQADLRYRPYFYEWSVKVTFEIDAELLKVDDLVALVDRAGFGVGIGEWRPEKSGEFGRFKVDTTFPISGV